MLCRETLDGRGMEDYYLLLLCSLLRTGVIAFYSERRRGEREDWGERVKEGERAGKSLELIILPFGFREKAKACLRFELASKGSMNVCTVVPAMQCNKTPRD